ncbi:ras GTPase-activating protein 1-like [Uloborus diversus]|uniref:ras GTPase-activating protein 1-like n=1 Tax=Uloborus diversus TaxID=327109 RepID=UPI002409A5C6|nr:ras GTPase-activating protein 1-like [Uloborus diversus]
MADHTKEDLENRLRRHSHSTPGSQEDVREGNMQEEFDPFLGEGDFFEENVNISLTAPPQTQWYHGRLDRYSAELRLQAASKLGSYLIRESDRKPGSYVLSYLGHTGINHFRITAVCGDYYIGGRQFDSLSDLIGYYTSWSDLLKKERLVYPVPPPEPVNDKKRVVAILPYNKMPDTDEISFLKGDIFIVHNDMGDGWLWCTLHRTQESGLVFKELVEELDDDVDPNEIYPWFHGTISKEAAVEKLAKMGPGSFLVRPSDNSPGNYSLFFHINNTIQRFRIEKRGNRYIMGGRCFDSLEAVISRYKVEQIVEGHHLGDPVLKAPYESKELSKAEEIQQKSQDIYATLRESRESGIAKRNKGIRMKGYLNKKSCFNPGQGNRKWKNLYFVLSAKEQQLLFFDNPRRTKPKGLIELNYTYLYMVHDSLFERPNCFQLVERALPCISTVYYLCASSPDLTQEWIQAIKPLCSPQLPRGRAPSHNVTEVRSLHLTLLEAHRLPVRLVPHPFCIISLNQVKVCRTQVKCPPDPIWEEDFILEDIPSDITSFAITLYNKGKRSKDTEIADVTVELENLINGEEIEDWFPLGGLTPPIREDWGSLRVRIRYIHEVIMPLAEYNALKELIMEEDLEVVSVLADLCHRDRTPLANAVLRVFRFERKEAMLLKTMNDREIQIEEDTTTLFRSASLTTTLMDHYMRSTANGFLHQAVQDFILKVMDSRQSCELNPSKLESPIEACTNAENMLGLLDEVIESIFSSIDSCPRTLRYICSCLQKSVMAKWPNDPLVKTRVVSGFVFLRLLCPAILNPRQFNLINDTPSEIAARSLILVAKCLQNLANLVEFGAKEPWMEVINPFILKNKNRMIKFLDDISNVPERPEPEETFSGDPARDLATLHHICATHKEELQNLSPHRPILKKLVTVTDMLSKHKQHYTEMLR